MATSFDVIAKTLATRGDVRDSQNKRGVIQASLDFFASGKKASASPHLIPAGMIGCPEPLRELHREAKAFSSAGLFSAIGRAWLSVDNRLYMWSLCDKTFTFVDSTVGTITGVFLIQPPSGLFPRSVTYAVVTVTESTLTIHGLTFDGPPLQSGLQIIEQPISTGTDGMLTKVTQHAKTGRVFGCATNGNLYEVEIFPTERRIQLSNVSTLFSGKPLLEFVGEIITNLHRSWTNSHSPLIDMVIDQERGILFTLSSAGHIDMWSLKQGDIAFVCRAEHSLDALSRSMKANAPTTLPVLKSIHLITVRRSACLTAVTNAGDRIFYTTRVQSWDVTGGQTLTASDRLAAPSGDLLWCQCFEDMMFCGARDRITTCSAPPPIFPTLGSALEICTTHRGNIHRCFGVDFLEPPRTSPDSLTQYYSAPAEIGVLTEAGILVFVRLRPVDVLNTLLADGDDEVLKSVMTAIGASEFAAMMILIASAGARGDLPFSSRVECTDPLVRNALQRIVCSPNADVMRRAMATLRDLSHPTINDSIASQGTWTMMLAPFANGLSIALSRSLSLIWFEKILNSKKRTLSISLTAQKRTEASLICLLSFLEQCRDELWFFVRETPLVVFSLTSATFTGTSAPTAQSIAEVQSARISGLYQIASYSRQVLRFVSFMGDISSSVVSTAAKEHPEICSVAFKDVVERPQTLAKFGRQVLKIVVDAEREANVPHYDCLLELFDEMERDCRDLFTVADSVGNQATLELDHFSRLHAQGYNIDGVETTLMRLKAHAAALLETGALDRVCGQLVGIGAVDAAIDVLMTAASQQPEQAAMEAYQNCASHKSLDAKTALVAKVASILERVWRHDRQLFFRLIQEPGFVWTIEATDSVTHFLLLDWLTAPRHDAHSTREMRRNIALCPSPWVEQYLLRHAHRLPLETAEYYRFHKRDFNTACKWYLSVATGQLSELAVTDRLQHRLHRTLDALTCAREAGLPATEIARIATQCETLEIQQQLLGVIQRFMSSNSPTLTEIVKIDETEMTQRQASEMHASRLCETVLSPEELFMIASFYRSLGGVEVQLRVLSSHQVTDTELFANSIASAFDSQPDTVKVALSLLPFASAPGFPLPAVIAHLLCNATVDLGTTLFDAAALPYEMVLNAMKVLIDNRTGCASLPAILPEKFYSLSAAALLTSYVSLLHFATAQRRGAMGSIAVHVHHAKRLFEKLGVAPDSAFRALEAEIESARGRANIFAPGSARVSMRW